MLAIQEMTAKGLQAMLNNLINGFKLIRNILDMVILILYFPQKIT